MKRKVFITGISSELMHHYVGLLDLQQIEVIGLSRKSDFTVPGIQLIASDLLEPESYREHLKDCDTIIHAAAITHSFSQKQYDEVNLGGTKAIVDLAKATNVKNFIFISSNTAGEQSGAYGISKLRAEEYIKEHLSSWLILRPSEVYGGSKKEGIDKLIADVLTNSFVLCPQGVPTDFYPIHLDDAVQAIHNASFDPEVLNTTQVIAGQKGYSFQQLIDLVKSISGQNPKVIYLKKSWMHWIGRMVKLLPFSIGFAPDQVDRLYSVKSVKNRYSVEERMSMEKYVEGLK